MGYLTTLTIYNDGVHMIKEDKKKFAEVIYEGIIEAHDSPVTKGFLNHGNLIHIQKSRHAEDHTMYVHMGNSLC